MNAAIALMILLLFCVVILLGLYGAWQTYCINQLIPKRSCNPERDLRPGDLLFFRTKDKSDKSLWTRLRYFVAKGAVGCPYTHVGVVCKSENRLCTLEAHVSRGCAVLRPLRARLDQFKGMVAIRRLRDRTLQQKDIRTFLRHELMQLNQNLRFAHTVDVTLQYVFQGTSAAEFGSTCADLAVRYLAAAGFGGDASVEHTISDLFWGNDFGFPREAPFRLKIQRV